MSIVSAKSRLRRTLDSLLEAPSFLICGVKGGVTAFRVVLEAPCFLICAVKGVVATGFNGDIGVDPDGMTISCANLLTIAAAEGVSGAEPEGVCTSCSDIMSDLANTGLDLVAV